jgi:uncharacterized C2H2 Zn-finger protein
VANPWAADRPARGWSPEGRIVMTPYRHSNCYPISVCLIMVTTNRFNLRRHRIGVHGGNTDKGSEYPCDVCQKIFHYNDNLKRHRKNVHGILPSIEGLPEQKIETQALQYTQEGEIISHDQQKLEALDSTSKALVALSDSKAFFCEMCNKNLQSNYNLKRHKAAVHKDTRILYGCDECDKNFTSITNYRRHKIMIHGPGKQAYRCEKCEKVLASKDGLRRHMESVHETIGKNFVCNSCGNRFLRKEYLTKHLKTHEFNYEVLPADTTTASDSM